MAATGNREPGSEYDVRDDDRSTPYARDKRRSGYGLVMVFGLLVLAAFFAYGLFHRGEVSNQSKPEATVGSTR